MAEKTRYSDEELQEFKELILEKLEKAKRDYEVLKASISGSDGNDIADTSPTFKVLEEFFPKRRPVGSLKGRQSLSLTWKPH